jgi:hypothetical protein
LSAGRKTSQPIYLSFERFEAAMEFAQPAKVLPEGIYFEGNLFWDRKLRYRAGQRVRVIADVGSAWGGKSCIVLSKKTGRFITTAEECTKEGVPVVDKATVSEIQAAIAEYKLHAFGGAE